MKNKIKKIAAVIFFIALFLVVLSVVSRVFVRKYSYEKYADFYTQKEDFDVLFLGTSHVLNAVYPMELWNDYGIVSYNLANSSENICTNYWQLKNILGYTTPQVVVVDLYAVDGDAKVNLKYLHNCTDTLPLSVNKIRMITDLLPIEEWTEYLFPFSIYHSRWNELTKEDISPVISTEKGAELRTDVTPDTAPQLISPDKYSAEDRVNKQYLQKIIDLCKKENIDVVLTYIPYNAPEGHQEVANWGYIIAEQNDVPYLNLLYEENILNYNTDCADLSSHLNASGARKVTNYLGDYLVNHYNIADRRTEETYAFWYDDYDEYEQFKIDWLNREQNIASYMILLNDKTLECTVHFSEDSYALKDAEIVNLLQNIESLGNIVYDVKDMVDTIIEIEVSRKDTEEVISQRRFMRIAENEYISEIPD